MGCLSLGFGCTFDRVGTGEAGLLAAGGVSVDAGVDVFTPDASFGGTFLGGAGGGAGGALAGGAGGWGGSGGAAECGNGIREAGEECDDGPPGSGDGCDADCRVECPDGASVGPNFHCYWFVRDPKNWNEARADCTSQNAYLVTLTGSVENAFIANLTYETFWIGATDSRTPEEAGVGPYSWISGEAFSYLNWAPGEPNASDKGCGILSRCYEHCATMQDDGTWNDRYCVDDSYPYVCERVPPGVN